MDEQQKAKIRETLIAKRDEIQGNVDRIDQETQWLAADQEDERGSLGNHLADDGSDVMEQERIGTIGEDLRDVLVQIEGALGRLDDGTYGTCQRCGKPINPERLEALPYAEYCIECQSELERERQLFGATRTG